MIPRSSHAAPLELGFVAGRIAIDMSLLAELQQTPRFARHSGIAELQRNYESHSEDDALRVTYAVRPAGVVKHEQAL